MAVPFFFETAYVSAGEAALRLLVAALAGGILGLDREVKNKPVGVRAYSLVALASAGFGLMTMELAAMAEGLPLQATIDPSRTIQGVIGGIGFLGAGAIFRSKSQVRGTATGAGVWTVGAIGLCCGFGFYWYALVITATGLAILTIIGWLRTQPADPND